MVTALVTSFIAAEVDAPANDLNPIALEIKELAWGFGAFVVFAVVLRYAIWPTFKRGLDARAERVSSDHSHAESLMSSARADVADYEAKRAALRQTAQGEIDRARATLEAERAEQLAAANARIAERRAAAFAEVEASRAAARGEVESAVASVVTAAGRLATGREPDADLVRRVVGDTLAQGVAS